MSHPYEIVDFATVQGVNCPCGVARRAFQDVADFPGTVHVTEISVDARLHYHRRLTETYFILECEPDAKLQLNDEILHVHPGLCVLIRSGVRHRAIGRMKVLIVVIPKFDPADEWFDGRCAVPPVEIRRLSPTLTRKHRQACVDRTRSIFE